MKAFLEPSGSLWCSRIQTSPLLLVLVKSCSESLPEDFSASKSNFCFLSKITLRCVVGNPRCWTISSYSFPLYFSAPTHCIQIYIALPSSFSANSSSQLVWGCLHLAFNLFSFFPLPSRKMSIMLPAAGTVRAQRRLSTWLVQSPEREWEKIVLLSSFHSRMNTVMHCARCLVPRSY